MIGCEPLEQKGRWVRLVSDPFLLLQHQFVQRKLLLQHHTAPSASTHDPRTWASYVNGAKSNVIFLNSTSSKLENSWLAENQAHVFLGYILGAPLRRDSIFGVLRHYNRNLFKPRHLTPTLNMFVFLVVHWSDLLISLRESMIYETCVFMAIWSSSGLGSFTHIFGLVSPLLPNNPTLHTPQAPGVKRPGKMRCSEARDVAIWSILLESIMFGRRGIPRLCQFHNEQRRFGTVA